MEDLWTLFCGCNAAKKCGFGLQTLINPSSCTNHALAISVNTLLLLMLFLNFIVQQQTKLARTPVRFQCTSALKILSAVLNVGLGLAYIGYGVWILEENLRMAHTVFPLHWWLVELIQGLTWLVLCLTMTGQLGKAFVRLVSTCFFSFTAFLCVICIYDSILEKEVSVKRVLDVLSLPSALTLLICSFKRQTIQESEQDVNKTSLYMPLNLDVSDRHKTDRIIGVTPLSKAGFFSKMFFWWLNPIMKKGKEKILNDEDIPQLREVDRAETCYNLFLEQLDKQKQRKPTKSPSILRVIIFCEWKDILLSGFFALLKILSLSSGPLLLNAFIELSEGKEAFRFEGSVLALSLFLSKFLESSSQRQWIFQTRLIGLRVRSLLSAIIYKKQQKLSNVAKMEHSAGEITNYVTVDAYRIGELPYWMHQTWTTSFQICIALVILVRSVGLATIASFVVIILTVLCNTPLTKLQLRFQSKLMAAQARRLKATTEALMNMRVLKLYAWETHFKNVVGSLRKEEYKWLSAVQLQKGYNAFLFWTSPVLVSVTTLAVCYVLHVPLHANNVFTFLATLRLLQEPINSIPDVIGAIIQARVALARIEKFLEAPELKSGSVRQMSNINLELKYRVIMKSVRLSWVENQSRPTLRNINLEIKPGEKVAICGEVGSGKSTLLTAILGEVPCIEGEVRVYGKTAYVSQTAWIQSGTIRENILFGSDMDKYQGTLEKCSLVKDLDMLPYGDLAEIGERGINLSGGQKQRVQLARALYQDADIYLLDDPFSAIDVHTATSLFNECIMVALAEKTVLLVTHQVDFLPAFDSVLLMSDGEILHAGHYHQLLAFSQEFQLLVNAHKDTTTSRSFTEVATPVASVASEEIRITCNDTRSNASQGDQLIKQEERETGDTGLKPYLQYFNQNKGFLYFSLASLCHLTFVTGLILQNSWMAAKVDSSHISELKLIAVYFVIGCVSVSFLLLRPISITAMGILSSESLLPGKSSSLPYQWVTL